MQHDCKLICKEITIFSLILLLLFGGSGEKGWAANLFDTKLSYALTESEINEESLELIPTIQQSQESGVLWIDYCNGVVQPEALRLHLNLTNMNTVTLSGWSADLVQGTPLSALYVYVGNEIFQCDYGEESIAVSEHYQNENLRYTGYTVTIPAKYFENVTQISFIRVSQDGTYRLNDVIYDVIQEVPQEAASTVINDELVVSPIMIVICLILVLITFLLLILFLVKNNGGDSILRLKQNSFLFSELVKRDFTLKYKRTVLGMFWSVLSPMINLLIMWLVFNKLLGSNIDHFVIYLFAGQLIFTYFSDATTLGMTSLLDNADIFSKVNVPKYLFLFSRNVSSLINFLLTLVVFFVFVVLEGIPFSFKFLSLLYPIICLVILNIGMGMILSALFMFFRDMRYLWGLATQLIMWLSAIFYSIDVFSEEVRMLFLLNPIYLAIRYFRKVVIENTIPTPEFHILMAFFSLGVFAIGCVIYKKKNHEFLYYV